METWIRLKNETCYVLDTIFRDVMGLGFISGCLIYDVWIVQVFRSFT